MISTTRSTHISSLPMTLARLKPPLIYMNNLFQLSPPLSCHQVAKTHPKTHKTSDTHQAQHVDASWTRTRRTALKAGAQPIYAEPRLYIRLMHSHQTLISECLRAQWKEVHPESKKSRVKDGAAPGGSLEFLCGGVDTLDNARGKRVILRCKKLIARVQLPLLQLQCRFFYGLLCMLGKYHEGVCERNEHRQPKLQERFYTSL